MAVFFSSVERKTKIYIILFAIMHIVLISFSPLFMLYNNLIHQIALMHNQEKQNDRKKKKKNNQIPLHVHPFNLLKRMNARRRSKKPKLELKFRQIYKIIKRIPNKALHTNFVCICQCNAVKKYVFFLSPSLNETDYW